jgi:ATPase subunit of ABC transporter with duplicated ATPase domains
MQNHLSGVDLGYRLPSDHLLFQSLTFSFSESRTALVGRNGVGKTTLIEILVGNLEPATGAFERVGRIAYLPQRVVVDADATVAQAISLEREIAAYERVLRGEAEPEDLDLLSDRWDLTERIERAFEQLGIGAITLDRRIDSLSGGEWTRLRIAGLLLEDPDFLILDEPTNHLDLEAREFIYDLISNWKKGLIVVSHDRSLLSRVDQIAELEPTGVKFYGGNYAFYREQREIERNAAQETFEAARQRLKDARSAAQRAHERQQRRQSAGKKKALGGNIPRIVAGGLQRASENSAGKLKGRHESKIESASLEVQTARRNLSIEHQIVIDLERSGVPAGKRLIGSSGVNYRYAGAPAMLWPVPIEFEVFGAERIWLKGSNGAAFDGRYQIGDGPHRFARSKNRRPRRRPDSARKRQTICAGAAGTRVEDASGSISFHSRRRFQTCLGAKRRRTDARRARLSARRRPGPGTLGPR